MLRQSHGRALGEGFNRLNTEDMIFASDCQQISSTLSCEQQNLKFERDPPTENAIRDVARVIDKAFIFRIVGVIGEQAFLGVQWAACKHKE